MEGGISVARQNHNGVLHALDRSSSAKHVLDSDIILIE